VRPVRPGGVHRLAVPLLYGTRACGAASFCDWMLRAGIGRRVSSASTVASQGASAAHRYPSSRPSVFRSIYLESERLAKRGAFRST